MSFPWVTLWSTSQKTSRSRQNPVLTGALAISRRDGAFTIVLLPLQAQDIINSVPWSDGSGSGHHPLGRFRVQSVAEDSRGIVTTPIRIHGPALTDCLTSNSLQALGGGLRGGRCGPSANKNSRFAIMESWGERERERGLPV